jgi:anti-sigma B factor antagonist
MARMAEAIQVTQSFENGVAIVTPVGDIGTHEANAFKQSVKEAFDKKPRRLVVDLSGVPYMATAGLATLVEAFQIASKTKVELVLCGLTDRVRAVFDISRLRSVFKIVDTVQQAVA